MRRGPASPERVLIVGTGPLARRLLREIEARGDPACAVVGLIDGSPREEESQTACPILGPLDQLPRIVAESRPGRIVVALEERRGRLPVHLLLEAKASGIAVEDGVEFYERLTGKLALESLTPSSLLFCGDLQPSLLGRALGRALSVLAAGAGLLLLAPLFALVALAIRLDSRGPVFFVQERVGLRGRRFRLVKFRTMHPAGESRSAWVRDNGDRITRVGRWLRKFRLDEIPQFINVLRGDMDLLGPRPHPETNFGTFLEKIPYYSLRCMVRPGLTGWAQVRYGYANGLEEEVEKMRYDLFYLKHRSLWLDLRILLETLEVVLLGRGAEASAVRAPHGRGAAPAPRPIPSRQAPSSRGPLSLPSQALGERRGAA